MSQENMVHSKDIGNTIKWEKKSPKKLDVNVGPTLKVSASGEIDVDKTKLPKVAEKDARSGDVTLTNPDGTKVVLETPRVRIGVNDNWFIDGVDTGKPSRGLQGNTGDKGEKGDNGDKGVDGKSAYDIAKEQGFQGDEQAWINTLYEDRDMIFQDAFGDELGHAFQTVRTHR